MRIRGVPRTRTTRMVTMMRTPSCLLHLLAPLPACVILSRLHLAVVATTAVLVGGAEVVAEGKVALVMHGITVVDVHHMRSVRSLC